MGRMLRATWTPGLGLAAVVAFAIAGTACAEEKRAGEPKEARQVAEEWSAAMSSGDSRAMAALMDPAGFRYRGRLVSTSDLALSLEGDAARQASSNVFSAFHVMDGGVRVVESAGDAAVLEIRLDLLEAYDKADPSLARFRYRIKTSARLHTVVVGTHRFVDLMEEDLPAGAPPVASFALVQCLRSEACERREAATVGKGRRRVETMAVTHRASGAAVVKIRHTFDHRPEPLGEVVSEVSTELLDARDEPVSNAEHFE